MYCKECGENNRNDRKFCTNCGAKLQDYTKPREDLIMPEEIKSKQDNITKFNKINRIISIVMALLLLLGIGFIVATFFTEGNLQLVFIVTCLVCLSTYVVLWITNFTITKKKNKNNKK